jgi:hypothetical protein
VITLPPVIYSAASGIVTINVPVTQYERSPDKRLGRRIPGVCDPIVLPCHSDRGGSAVC